MNIKQMVWGFLFYNSFAFGQVTFNNRLDFDRPLPSILTSILVEDSCYYFSGLTFDTLPPFRLGSLFGKMDASGNILDLNIKTDSETITQLWLNTLTKTKGNDFTVTGRYVDSISASAMLLKFDTQGEIIFREIFRSPYSSIDPFIAPISSIKTENEGYLLASNISTDLAKTDMYLLKTDSLGEVEWEEVYGGNIWSESSGALLSIGDKRYILGGMEHNINFVSNNHKSRTYLLQIDSLGEIEWEYKSPEGELQGNANDILQSPDGGFIIASTKGIEQMSGPNSYLQWRHYIYKIDSNREFEWGVDIRDTLAQSTNQFTKLIAPSDGSGYIAVGQIYKPNYDEGGYDLNGLITKISPSGDSLWTRYYNHVESPADNHIFYDVEETPDGGFVMVGQATDMMTTGELPLQQAWIVKVDQYGCLVPGCHLIDAVEEPLLELQLSLYPNPASDYLNLYYYHPNHTGTVTYRIIDLQGRVLRSFKSSMNNVTHMVSVSDLAVGQYYLVVERERGEVVTKGFVKG